MSVKQIRLSSIKQKPYSYGSYNKFNDNEQWIRISEGCLHNCPYCREPQEQKVFEIPEIIRNDVKIMDMNLLCKEASLEIIEELGKIKVDGKVVYYELVCGIDYHFLNERLAYALKQSRFKNIRIAWDWWVADQYKIKDAITILKKAGYAPRDIMIFMICNWNIPYSDCCSKLDICKVWNVKVGDCWFDNQTAPNIIPIHWEEQEIKDFRRKCRKHNQLVNFGIDPEIKIKESI